MALINCHECGKEVSTEAAACPHCGLKPKKKVGALGLTFAGIFVAYMMYSLAGTSSMAPPPPSPKEEKIFKTVVGAMMLVKSNAREPESITWEEAIANATGDLICLAYRGRNGFGGMTRELFIVRKDKTHSSAEVWNKHCTAKTNKSYLHARHALK